MDIPRQPRSNRGRLIYGGGGILLLLGATAALATLKPAVPSVEAGTLIIDSVRRGPLIIQVRGPGTLVPEQIRWVTAVTAGRVERRLAEPGQKVTPATVLMVLTNPDVQLEALESERQLTQAQSERVNVQVNLQTQRLNQQSVVATVQAEYRDARRQAEAADSPARGNMISRIEASRTQGAFRGAGDAAQGGAGTPGALYRRRGFAAGAAARAGRAAPGRDRVPAGPGPFHGSARRSRRRGAGDSARGGAVGAAGGHARQGGAAGAPQGGAPHSRDPGQGRRRRAAGGVDTRNGIIQGHVMRIDPASQNGTVTVDVALDARASAGRATRPQRRRHDRDRASQRRALHRPAGVRPGRTPPWKCSAWSTAGNTPSASRCSSAAHR